MFVRPEVKRLIYSIDFPRCCLRFERSAWACFESVVNGFLGNHKAENDRELMDAYQRMDRRMSLKVHVLHAVLDEFKYNIGDYLEEHSENFHQNVKSFEERYKGQHNESMMGDCTWNFLHESEKKILITLSYKFLAQ